MKLRSRSVVGLLAAMTLVSACGGSAATTAPAPATAAPATAAPATAAPSAEAPSAEAPSAAASGAPALAELCTNPTVPAGTTLTVSSYGGAYQEAQRKAWFEPYAALTGVTIVESEDSANATIKAQVESGQVTWDVVDVGNDFGLEGNADVLEPLDFTRIPKDEILPGFADTYRVAAITYGIVMAYRTDKFDGATPQTWADFFDLAKFPGKRGLYDYSTGGVLEIALMADGVAPKDLYPLDVPRALAKLDTIKDSIVWWSSGAKSQEQIGSGETVMAQMWNGRAWSAKNVDSKPVEIQWNQQLLVADYWVVPKGTPNKDQAMQFIAWMSCANNNANVSRYISYGPPNKFAVPDPAMAKDLAVSNLNDTSATMNDKWLIDNTATLDQQFNDWKTK
jgi:putative spermidine/putrescine transport system substrate-binding protein